MSNPFLGAGNRDGECCSSVTVCNFQFFFYLVNIVKCCCQGFDIWLTTWESAPCTLSFLERRKALRRMWLVCWNPPTLTKIYNVSFYFLESRKSWWADGECSSFITAIFCPSFPSKWILKSMMYINVFLLLGSRKALCRMWLVRHCIFLSIASSLSLSLDQNTSPSTLNYLTLSHPYLP